MLLEVAQKRANHLLAQLVTRASRSSGRVATTNPVRHLAAHEVCQCAGNSLEVKAATGDGLTVQRIGPAQPGHSAPGHHCRAKRSRRLRKVTRIFDERVI